MPSLTEGMTSYQKLENKFNRLYRLEHFAGLAYWDEATTMPTGSADARAQAMAELSILSQEILCSLETKEFIEESKAKSDSLSDWQKANLRQMERQYLLKSVLPVDLLKAVALANSKSEQAWRKLRSQNNWKEFLPLFTEVVKLARETAAHYSSALKLPLYDSLMEVFAPGLSSQTVGRAFNDLREFLPGAIQKAQAKQKSYVDAKGVYPTQLQKSLGMEVMQALGFNFEAGRLDESHHPFCGGMNEDVRLTTRYREDEFISSLMGIVHETGHALYAQNTPEAWRTQPVGQNHGMAIHESQSLFFEMQVGRSKEFLTFLLPKILKAFRSAGDDAGFFELENLHRMLLQVKPGFIRVDADEITYPAHIILRFEIEKALIEGEIKVTEIPDVWNEKMQKYLGLSTAGNFKDGCMQDVHWPSGSFGYFPSYTFGAIIAAQLFASLEKAHPNVRQEIAQGEFATIRNWLREKIWYQGNYFHTEDLVKSATGEPINISYFKNHLERRYL